MTAKDMFDTLGYHQIKNDEEMIGYQRQNVCVVFYKETKTIQSYENYRGYPLVVNTTIMTLKAINKQAKELGWIK